MAVEYFPVADDLTGRATPLPPNVFLLNWGNSEFVSGERRRIGSSRTMFIIIAIVVLIAGGIYLATTGEARRLRAIEENGVKVEGVITDGRSVRSRRSSSYYVTYRYSVDRVPYWHEQEVSGSHYTSLSIGEPVTVKYMPDDPEVAALSGDDLDFTVISENETFAAIAAVIGGIIVSIMLLVDYRNRRYSFRGRLLPGEIIHAVGKPGSKGAYNVTVNYRFRTPSGEILEKKSTANRRDLRNALPVPGTPVMVLYVSNRMQRLM